MRYHIVMVDGVPNYVVPENATYPESFNSVAEAVEESSSTLQKKLDREDGITSKWKRKRHVSIFKCDGYDPPEENTELKQVADYEG